MIFQYQRQARPILPPSTPPVVLPDQWWPSYPNQVPRHLVPRLWVGFLLRQLPGLPGFGIPEGIFFPINERSTGRYQATLVGEDGVTPLPGSLVTALTLTLYMTQQDDTDIIINGRNRQDVLNTNNVALSTGGVLTWTVQPGDTTLVDPTVPFERHIALFEWAWLGGGAGKKEVLLIVRNLRRVS